MTIDEILNFIASNGFAIVVAVYCLTTLNKNISANNETLTELKTLIKQLVKDNEEKEEDE